MGKVVTIHSCEDCPNRIHIGFEIHCNVNEKRVDENKPIPNWCALPNRDDIVFIQKED
jgi:hypothetical protein